MVDGVFSIGASEVDELQSLLAVAPAQHVFVRSRVLSGIDSLGHPILGWRENGILRSALYVGPNLVPVELNADSLEAFCEVLLERDRSCASIVGDSVDVQALWQRLAPVWSPARLIRDHQPYLVLEDQVESQVHAVHRIELRNLDSYVVASAAMFAGEVGINADQLNASGYRLRVQETIRQGRAYGLVDEFGVTRFKTDVGCVTDDYCQIQGVWLHPEWRGRGLAVDLLASAISHIQRDFSAGVCLYVNDFNAPALATYRRLGFKPLAEFSTIFF